MLHHPYSESNFYLKVDENDSLFQNPAIFGVPSSGGDVWMTPKNGVDVILFTEKQHYFIKEED